MSIRLSTKKARHLVRLQSGVLGDGAGFEGVAGKSMIVDDEPRILVRIGRNVVDVPFYLGVGVLLIRANRAVKLVSFERRVADIRRPDRNDSGTTG